MVRNARVAGRLARIVAVAWAAALVSAQAGAGPANPVFDVSLRPVREAGPVPVAVEVRERLSAAPPGARQDAFALRVPVTYAAAEGIADRIERLEVHDSSGLVPLAQLADTSEMGGFVLMRHWQAGRPVSYPVTVAYRARVAKPGGPNGPPWALRESAGGVSASGAGFLVLPEIDGQYTIRGHWDLDDLAAGSSGATSFGDGDFELTGAIEELNDGWYMAGPGGRYPARGAVDGFSAMWLGDTPFDAASAMEYAARAHSALSRFFRDATPPPYHVFMLVLQEPPYGGGTALTDSFMLSMGPAPRTPGSQAPLSTFVHEMVHHWVGGIEGSPRVTPWFHEGLTVFYTGLLPLRAGLGSVDDYARDINERARAYYSSSGRNLSAEDVGRAGFGKGEDIRHVPYNRGSLYFADLDARIRAASNGRRRLDDVVFALFERRRVQGKVDQNDWLELVVKELGPSAKEQWEAVNMRGGTIVPRSDAFGPCFERRPVQYTVGGKDADGFEWVRVTSVPDETCRAW